MEVAKKNNNVGDSRVGERQEMCCLNRHGFNSKQREIERIVILENPGAFF